MGLVLCDRETAACGLLEVSLIQSGVFALEGCCVQSVGNNSGKPRNVLSGGQFLEVAGVHFGFDAVLECFDFGGSFGGQLFPFFEGFDFFDDFER